MKFKFCDYFKIVLVGDSGVGKTDLLSKYIKKTSSPDKKPTIGVEFEAKTIKFNKEEIRVQFWDTAGQEKYKSITSGYYRGASGALIVYDITSPSSFKSLNYWINEIRKKTKNNLKIVIVGNKIDLRDLRLINTEMGKKFAEKKGTFFIETSASDGTNVKKAFEILIENILICQEKIILINDRNNFLFLPEGKKIGNKRNELLNNHCC